MGIDVNVRIKALEIACNAEQEAIARAERAGNYTAVLHNRKRLIAAQNRLQSFISSQQASLSSRPFP